MSKFSCSFACPACPVKFFLISLGLNLFFIFYPVKSILENRRFYLTGWTGVSFCIRGESIFMWNINHRIYSMGLRIHLRSPTLVGRIFENLFIYKLIRLSSLTEVGYAGWIICHPQFNWGMNSMVKVLVWIIFYW